MNRNESRSSASGRQGGSALLRDLRTAIPRSLPVACEILPFELDPNPAYHAERQQYHSSEILQRMQALVRPQDWRLLAVADVDLYIPILKYVFGEAQLAGRALWFPRTACTRDSTASTATMTCCGSACSKSRFTSWATLWICATARTTAA